MITYESWSDVREALNEAEDSGLINSWQHVPSLGLAVIAGDMDEVPVKSLEQASYFLAGLASKECAYRDGKAKTGTEGEGS